MRKGCGKKCVKYLRTRVSYNYYYNNIQEERKRKKKVTNKMKNATRKNQALTFMKKIRFLITFSIVWKRVHRTKNQIFLRL